MGTFDDARTLGDPAASISPVTGEGIRTVAPEFPRSAHPRGLALRELVVTENWDGIWGWLRDNRHGIYFTSVAVDLSGEKATVQPPKEVTSDLIHNVTVGDAIRFTLGKGAPIFGPRTIVGGLSVFVMIFESDGDVRAAGKTVAAIHEDVSKDDGDFAAKLAKLVSKPGQVVAGEVLDALTVALTPIATLLKSNGDDNVGMLRAIYLPDDPWTGQLVQEWNGNRVELVEL